MIYRKIEKELSAWKHKENHKPLLITGMRQVGKTTTIENFANKNYKRVIELNFIENRQYDEAFYPSRKVDDIIKKLSAFFDLDYLPIGETLFIFDEIQESKSAMTSLKFFALDKRYDVIATGSYLGVIGYNNLTKEYNETESYPVGYVDVLNMFPLDFEEFLIANKYDGYLSNIDYSFINRQALPNELNKTLLELYKQYVIVGGMPEAVNSYLENKSYKEVYKVQENIINMLKSDILKHVDNKEKLKILDTFSSIPSQLAKDNKKFKYSEIKSNGNSTIYLPSILYLEGAKIINRCFNVTLLQPPLKGYVNTKDFKIYLSDSGLLINMLGIKNQQMLLQTSFNDLYKGPIFENAVASELSKFNQGDDLYFYRNEKGTLEIDFIYNATKNIIPIEVKAYNGNAKSLKELMQNKKYCVDYSIKLGAYNVGFEKNILTLPIYMTYLLKTL